MLLMLLGLQHAARADEAETERAVLLARGQAVLRAMDCARCHGRDYRGWAAPSLLAAVREGSRERFERSVLDGDPVRGMPGYRSQPLVVAGIDAIHAYLPVRRRHPGPHGESCGRHVGRGVLVELIEAVRGNPGRRR